MIFRLSPQGVKCAMLSVILNALPGKALQYFGAMGSILILRNSLVLVVNKLIECNLIVNSGS